MPTLQADAFVGDSDQPLAEPAQQLPVAVGAPFDDRRVQKDPIGIVIARLDEPNLAQIARRRARVAIEAYDAQVFVVQILRRPFLAIVGLL